MKTNSETVNLFLGNFNDKGKRTKTWITIGKQNSMDPKVFARISGIKKRCTPEVFDLFIECMHNEETVLVSNGTSSSSIEHIALLLRAGHSIVGKGKATNNYSSRKDVSSIYLLCSDNYYKIGVTLDTSIERRIKQLQCGNPHVISLVAKSGTINNAYELENKLHKKFKSNVVRGEWFTFNDDELEYVVNSFNMEEE